MIYYGQCVTTVMPSSVRVICRENQMKTLVIARIFLPVYALYFAWAAMFEPQTNSFHIVSVNGVFGKSVIFVLFFLSVICLLDALINDLLPSRFSFKWSHKVRHYFFLAIGICLFMHSFVLIKSGVSIGVGALYWLTGLFCIAVSFADVYSEFAIKIRERRSSDRKTEKCVTHSD